MIVNLLIDCETGGQMIQHIVKVMLDLETKINFHKKESGLIKKPFVFEDNNCYGYHKAVLDDFSFDELEYEFDLSKINLDEARKAEINNFPPDEKPKK